jgi:hypothetical protein
MAGDSEFRVLCYTAEGYVQRLYCHTKAEADDLVKRNLPNYERCVIEQSVGWNIVEDHINSN